MKIIIAGSGEVGFHLAKMLTIEAQDIHVIDTDQDRLNYVDSHIDVIAVKGDATSPGVLKDSGIKNADLMIAVTSSQETNIVAAILAKKMGAKKTIARIRNYEFLGAEIKNQFLELGIDTLFSPRELASKEILRLIKQSALTDNFEFSDGLLSLIGITLDQRSQLIDHSVEATKELNVDFDFLPVAILRKGKTIIPRGETILKKHDHIYFIVKKGHIDYVLKISGKQNIEIKNVMILGGSDIGALTAEMMQKDYKVKIVEKNKNRCMELVERLPNTLIINADPHEVEALEEENLSEMDACISLTGDSETNIISCLVAKSHGVKKTIASVENIDYINLSQNIGVDTLINKKLIAVNNIFRYIRQGDVSSIASLHGVRAEIIEFIAQDRDPIVRKKIKDLNFPKAAIIGGVVRNNEAIIPNGEFQIISNDHVVVVAFESAIKKVEKYFK